MPKTRTPVVRRGQLVRASDRTTGKPETLSLTQSRKALMLLGKGADRAFQKMCEAMRRALPDREVAIDVDQSGRLSPAGRAGGLGVIFNYRECVIQIDGARIVARATVTLCVTPARDLAREDGAAPFSKFWTRFILASHPQLDLEDVEDDAVDAAIARFYDDCSALHAAAMGALEPIYAAALEKAMERRLKLDADGNGAFAVLTVEASGADTPEFFEAASQGKAFREQLKIAPQATNRLMRLAMPVIGCGAQASVASAEQAVIEGGNYQVLRYDTPDDDVGVFILKAEPNLATFVGLAMPRHTRDGRPAAYEAEDARHSVSNIVSAALASDYAQHF